MKTRSISSLYNDKYQLIIYSPSAKFNYNWSVFFIIIVIEVKKK